MSLFLLRGPLVTLRIKEFILIGQMIHVITSARLSDTTFSFSLLHALDFGDPGLFAVPFTYQIPSSCEAFIHAVPTAWNHLPTALQTACFLNSFHHFQQALTTISKIATFPSQLFFNPQSVSVFFESLIITRNIQVHVFGLYPPTRISTRARTLSCLLLYPQPLKH